MHFDASRTLLAEALWRCIAAAFGACEIMRKKAVHNAIFIGAKRDPYKWAKENGYEYHNPVFRKILDNVGAEATGFAPVPTGLHCDEINY